MGLYRATGDIALRIGAVRESSPCPGLPGDGAVDADAGEEDEEGPVPACLPNQPTCGAAGTGAVSLPRGIAPGGEGRDAVWCAREAAPTSAGHAAEAEGVALADLDTCPSSLAERLLRWAAAIAAGRRPADEADLMLADVEETTEPAGPGPAVLHGDRTGVVCGHRCPLDEATTTAVRGGTTEQIE